MIFPCIYFAKKVSGIVVVILGVILFISSLRSVFNVFLRLLKIKSGYDAGYSFGYMIMAILFIALSVWIIERGGRMLKKKEKSIEEKIEEL